MTRWQKYLLSSTVLGLLGLVVVFSGHPALADNSLINSQEGFDELGGIFSGQPEDIRITVAKMINIALGFLGVIFIGLTVFAGFQYMTSGGNQEKTSHAVGLLKNAVIGLLIILAAWSITRYSIIIMQKTFDNSVDYTRYQ